MTSFTKSKKKNVSDLPKDNEDVNVLHIGNRTGLQLSEKPCVFLCQSSNIKTVLSHTSMSPNMSTSR